jgi:hypothetical protein
MYIVHCHAGSLEIYGQNLRQSNDVHCHTGSLEIEQLYAKISHYFNSIGLIAKSYRTSLTVQQSLLNL